jgi:hypothetical protein
MTLQDANVFKFSRTLLAKRELITEFLLWLGRHQRSSKFPLAWKSTATLAQCASETMTERAFSQRKMPFHPRSSPAI